jgi:4-diphosphocytidyl-2-C-methyl-D-erythritol kinase
VTRLEIRAHAKINLHLGILGRRADGYHEVETVLQTLALHDTLTCETYDGPFALTCDRPDVPVDASNLVWRAASLLAERVGQPALATYGTRIAIEKRVPMQAGLGGGSADAASTLLVLAKVWQLDVDGETLRQVGSRLGADVPFFFEGGTALGTGRGDALRPLPDVPASAVVVVMPPFGVPTAEAYRWHDEAVETGRAAGREMRHDGLAVAAAAADVPGARAIGRWPEAAWQWAAWFGRCRNDFEPVVGERYPVVTEAIARLTASGARLAALSGSGAALFGLFDTDAAAVAAAGECERPGWRTFVSRTVDRASYLGSLPSPAC